MTVPVSALQEIAPGAVIELFELELNTAQHGTSDIYRFHAGTNLNNNDEIIWNGNSYLRFPVEADGFEYSGNGQLPRPKIRVSNILSTITALLLTLPDGLEGAKFTRIRTLARYLDAVNFPATETLLTEDGFDLLYEDGSSIYLESLSPYSPDPLAEFPREIFYVDRKTIENRDVVEFELAAAFDLAGVSAPKRQCIANICQWKYRSTECGYNGPPVATVDGAEIAFANSPEAAAYYAADATVQSTKAALSTATTNLNNALNTLNLAQETLSVLAEDRYSASPPMYGVFTFRALWNGSDVALGGVYRIGTQVSATSFRITRWTVDSTAVTNAQNAYNSALSAYNTANTNYDNALSARAAAFTAWQAANFTADVAASNDACGKKLSDCKLRFNLDNITATEELPFGSFPGIGTFFS